MKFTRRNFAKTAAVAPFAPLAAFETDAVDDTLSALVLAHAGITGFTPPSEAALYGTDGDPGWHVEYSEEKRESLVEWVDADDKRSILSENTDERLMSIQAPAGHIGVSFVDRLGGIGLASRKYVESIDLVLDVERPEPVTLATEDDGWRDLSALESALMRFRLASPPSPSGVAFADDAPEITVSDAVAVTGADATGVDTSGLTIAVVDTGLNTADGELFDDPDAADGAEGYEALRVSGASKNVINDEDVATDGLAAVADGNGHGTWVASCIAADPTDSAYQGYLPGAEIVAVKALDDEGRGTTADIAEGIRYAADQGVDAICMSLGSPLYSVELDRALSYAAGAGALPVVAVGNDRQASRWVASPADGSDAVGVAAVTGHESYEEIQSAYFSNVGPDPGTGDFSGGETTRQSPDVCAPGMAVEAMVATQQGATATERLSGTSMAAPCVVGVAGHVMVADSAVRGDVEALSDRLTEFAQPVENVAVAECGSGLAHAQNTIDEAELEDDQDGAMSQDAVARDQSYRTLSRAQGGLVARIVRGR